MFALSYFNATHTISLNEMSFISLEFITLLFVTRTIVLHGLYISFVAVLDFIEVENMFVFVNVKYIIICLVYTLSFLMTYIFNVILSKI